MAFAVLAEREAQITQSLLLSNIFPEEIPEEIEEPPVPAIIQDTAPAPVIDTTPNTGLIVLPENTTIQVPANGTVIIYTNGNATWYTDATVNDTRITTGRIYTSTQTSATNCVIWTPENNGTAITQNVIRTVGTTNGTYVAATTGTWYYTNAYVNGQVCGNWTPPKPKPLQKFVKNSIKRALKLLDNFGLEQDTKIFLKGDEVEVSHPESMFKFVITKRTYSNIIEQTERPSRTVPFKLELFTKSGLHVANLCVYAEDTPMLDQLFMIAMYVKSGNEEDLLRKANFMTVTRDLQLKELIVSEVEYLGPKLLGRNHGTYINRDITENIITNGALIPA